MTAWDARRTRAWLAGIFGGLATLALVLSAVFGPEAMANGAPVRLLGLEPYHCPGCPMCGMSRAFSCVAHGELARAFELNHAVVIAFPLAIVLAGAGVHFVREHLRRS